ncbi:hypothetical protein RV134_250314 [Roseovarius sp. EC-HK134]|nr:hypothetical protein RV134_250314 [Roseovarius sp. EC-HK134]VVT07933.1 hypothetical protein RV420_290158 [Roseovarius sp. EC-SD190]
MFRAGGFNGHSPQSPPRSARPPPRAGAFATYRLSENAEELAGINCPSLLLLRPPGGQAPRSLRQDAPPLTPREQS